MTISKLIERLEKAKSIYGDLNVLMECDCDNEIADVAYVDTNPNKTYPTYIYLTDNAEALYEIFNQDPEDTDMIVEVM